MKICIVCDVLGKENNGTTIAGMNLIRSLKEKGHQLNIICNDISKKDEDGYFIVPELNIPIITYIIHKNGVKISRLDKKTVLNALQGVDHVHLLLPFKLSHFAAKYCKKHHIPLSASFHCQAENVTSHLGLKNCDLLSNLIYKRYYKRVYQHVDLIHYPTQFIRDVFESIVGPTNGVVISNGVNDIYHKKEVVRPLRFVDKFVILNIGRLCSEKNQKILIKAISVSQFKNKIHLVLAGSGPDKAKIMKLAKKLGVSIENTFYSREDLVNIINSADLYCHPAEMEIESISCIEAISCGLVPVISDSKKSATRFFALNEKCLFKNNDYKELASKIDYWIEHPEEKEELSHLYINNKFQFNQQYCMNKMEEMILQLHSKKDEVQV